MFSSKKSLSLNEQVEQLIGKYRAICHCQFALQNVLSDYKDDLIKRLQVNESILSAMESYISIHSNITGEIMGLKKDLQDIASEEKNSAKSNLKKLISTAQDKLTQIDKKVSQLERQVKFILFILTVYIEGAHETDRKEFIALFQTQVCKDLNSAYIKNKTYEQFRLTEEFKTEYQNLQAALKKQYDKATCDSIIETLKAKHHYVHDLMQKRHQLTHKEYDSDTGTATLTSDDKKQDFAHQLQAVDEQIKQATQAREQYIQGFLSVIPRKLFDDFLRTHSSVLKSELQHHMVATELQEQKNKFFAWLDNMLKSQFASQIEKQDIQKALVLLDSKLTKNAAPASSLFHASSASSSASSASVSLPDDQVNSDEEKSEASSESEKDEAEDSSDVSLEHGFFTPRSPSLSPPLPPTPPPSPTLHNMGCD